jgi:hypothetical protein
LSIDVTYDPISINSGPVTVDIEGLNNIQISIPDPVKTDSKLTLEVPHTIKTDTAVTFSIPEPIRTETKADFSFRVGVDVQPVVVDQCLRLSLGPLPPTHICLPYRQHVGLTLFGVEIFGLSLDGEAQVVVGERQRHTHVVRSSAAGTEIGDEGIRARFDR